MEINDIVLRLNTLEVEEVLHVVVDWVSQQFLQGSFNYFTTGVTQVWHELSQIELDSHEKVPARGKNSNSPEWGLDVPFEESEPLEIKICVSSEHKTKKCPNWVTCHASNINLSEQKILMMKWGLRQFLNLSSLSLRASFMSNSN